MVLLAARPFRCPFGGQREPNGPAPGCCLCVGEESHRVRLPHMLPVSRERIELGLDRVRKATCTRPSAVVPSVSLSLRGLSDFAYVEGRRMATGMVSPRDSL